MMVPDMRNKWRADGCRATGVTIFSVVAATLLVSGSASAQSTETVEYYGVDALGSVRVVFDASGQITGRMDYGPFGESLGTGSGTPSRAYAELFRDGEAGLDHAEARSYQSRTGRFTATDAVYAGLANPQGWNRYAYVGNNPINETDPSGACPDGWMCFTWTDIVYGKLFGNTTGGGGGAGGSGSSETQRDQSKAGGGGAGGGQPTKSPTSTDVTLPAPQEQVLQNALATLINDNCTATVGARIQGFDNAAFQTYLGQGANFYDGTKSTTAAALLYPGIAGPSFSSQHPGVTSIASWFSSNPGINAVTSIVATTFTTYVRPQTINMANSGINARNRSLVFHEALHGYGMGRSDYMDGGPKRNTGGLMQAFNLKGPSAQITKFIARKCK